MVFGAGGSLLRSTGFFDGGGSASHLIVLAAWAAAGVLVLHLADFRLQRAEVRAS